MLGRFFVHLRNQWMGALALFIVLAGGAAYAAFDPVGPDGDIDACYAKRSGDLHLLKGRKCGRKERPITWSEVGPQGPVGREGPQGPQGEPGATGAPGSSIFDASIPSGKTISGVWSNNGNESTSVSFPVPAPADLANATQVNFAAGQGSAPIDDDASCTGTVNQPTAPADKVCLYISSYSGAADTLQGRELFSSNGRRGFVVQANNQAFLSAGTWAYTAP